MTELRGKKLLAAVTILTSLGFMQIGYDNGLMGGFAYTPTFTGTFGIDKDSWNGQLIGFIVSIFELGCFFGSIASSFFGEPLGRRKSVLVGVFTMLIGLILMASSYSLAQILIARFILGLGMGTVNSVVPVLMAEFAPKATRGVYVCMQLSTLNFGIFMVYWITYGFQTLSLGASTSYCWRVPTALQGLFLLAMIPILLIIPETPRWLAARDRNEECLAVLRQLYDGRESHEEIQQIHTSIVNTVAMEAVASSGKWSELWKNDAIQTRRRFLIACAIQAFQQLGGINALIYYAQFIFSSSLGFDDHTASLMSSYLNTWFFVASFIPWLLIDRLGRRKLFLGSISVMAGVFIVQTGLIYQVQNTTSIAHSAGIGAAAMLFVFQGAFTVGFQATVWVYPSEILPLRIRQKGSSISTSANWIMNFLIVYITPVMINNIGWKTYIVFAALNLSFLPIIYLFFPETKGLALEDVDRLFCDEMTLSLVQETDKAKEEYRESVTEV